MNDRQGLELAAKEAQRGVGLDHGGPFGAVIVKEGKVISRAHNEVIRLNDPTAHAEVLAIRRAAKKLGGFNLEGCTLYTSCEPCPMCLGAVLWARISRVVYGVDRNDAATIGFDDSDFYRFFDNKEEQKRWMSLERLHCDSCLRVMHEWNLNPEHKIY